MPRSASQPCAVHEPHTDGKYEIDGMNVSRDKMRIGRTRREVRLSTESNADVGAIADSPRRSRETRTARRGVAAYGLPILDHGAPLRRRLRSARKVRAKYRSSRS